MAKAESMPKITLLFELTDIISTSLMNKIDSEWKFL
jgi:hypothetical protein